MVALWKININPTKTVCMLFSKKANPDNNFVVKLNNDIIKLSTHHKHLGLWLTNNVSWKKHISEIATKARKRLGCLKLHSFRMSRRSLELCYLTFVRPVMEYGNVMYDSASDEDLNILSEIEKDAMRTITGARKKCNLDKLYKEFKWPTLAVRRANQKITTLGKIIIKNYPPYLVRDLPTFYRDSRTNRKNTFATPTCTKDYYVKSFIPSSIALWNDLPYNVRTCQSYDSLKNRIKSMSLNNVPDYYYHGSRLCNILHCRLRLGCSNLNADKYLIGISNTDLCDCGERETAEHYLLDCGIELEKRVKMLDSILDVLKNKGLSDDRIDQIFGADLLLYGSGELDINENTSIFEAVQLFLWESDRL